MENQLIRCFVGDKRAFFHRWIDKEMPIIKINSQFSYKNAERYIDTIKKHNIVPFGCEVIMQKSTFGLIEYEDGTVAEVDPTSIRFDVECI